MFTKRVSPGLCILFCLPVFSFAQQPVSPAEFGDSFGISASFGDAAAIGLRLPIVQSFLLRPEISFSNSKTHLPGTLTPEHSLVFVETTIDLLYLFEDTSKPFQPYLGLGPGLSYYDLRPASTTQRKFIAKVFIGGNFWLSRHFGFYTEIGFATYCDLNDQDFLIQSRAAIGANLSF